ncbi:low temperature requirement protein A [Streptomyces sp. ODS28]|uniref:low temperature requirement protein A n=1 Tax=Streptomyces sp. ODS28 TaxID=3136688 RepID=UPI0031E5C7D4
MDAPGNAEAAGTGTRAAAESERHASWIELFFDLVVVAGIGQLAHLLHDGPDLADVALYALLYLAFWISWACFTVYGDVEGEGVSPPRMLLAMLGLAVMIAAVPGVRGAHGTAFVLAYVFLRWFAGRIWSRGKVVMDWPLAQFGAGALPWLVSVWVDAPARYRLWALGIALDLLVMLAASGRRMFGNAQRKLDRLLAHRPAPRPDPAGRRRGPTGPPRLEAAYSDAPHLAERLGLYVIIVLGEGVIQVVTAAAEVPWDLPLSATAVGAFALLIGVWMLSLLYGFAGVPRLAEGAVAPRLTMGLHCVATMGLAALAAGLGAAAEHPHGPVDPGVRWLLCAALACYFAVGLLAGCAAGRGWAWCGGWGLPGVVLPLLLGLFGAPLDAGWLVWVLAALVCWQVLHASGPPRRPANSRAPQAA